MDSVQNAFTETLSMAIDGHDNSENIRNNAENISNLQKEISFEFNSSTLEMLDRQLKVRN